MKEILTYAKLPIPLPFEQGRLYGSSLHDWRYPPEQETVRFFKKHLTQDDIVADVGANIGYYTLLFSNLARYVVALEPSPRAFKYLSKSVRFKKNVRLINAGAYSHPATLPLYNSGSGLGSLVYKNGGGKTDVVNLIRLDSLEYTFTWAKIDVEGAELEVLKGMRPCNVVAEAAGLEGKHDEVRALGYDIEPIGKDGNLYLKPRAAFDAPHF